MPRIRQYMHQTNGWAQATAGVNANTGDLPYLLEPTASLEEMTVQVHGMSHELATLDARRGEVVAALHRKIQEGNALMDVLRTGARQRYGYRSPKLIEFGIQPLPSRTKETKAPEPPPTGPETTAPADSTPDTLK